MPMAEIEVPQCHECGWTPYNGGNETLWRDGPDYICGSCLGKYLRDLPLDELARAFEMERVWTQSQ